MAGPRPRSGLQKEVLALYRRWVIIDLSPNIKSAELCESQRIAECEQETSSRYRKHQILGKLTFQFRE